MTHLDISVVNYAHGGGIGPSGEVACTNWNFTGLPGVSTLVRLVAARREAANRRLWETLHDLLDDEQRISLDGLLEVPDGHRNSHLDRLRRPPVRVSGPAMVDALQRAAEILGLGFVEVDTELVPPRRLAELSRNRLALSCTPSRLGSHESRSNRPRLRLRLCRGRSRSGGLLPPN